MSPAERWIRERLPKAPTRLVIPMIAALPEGEGIAESLAAAAMSLYREVAAGSGGREDALPLLAADALFTHAFQAQAEQNPTELDFFADRWSGMNAVGRFE